MKKYSVAEFSEFCSELHPVTYTYSDENQDAPNKTKCLASKFDNIRISMQPNCICFYSKTSRLNLYRVKTIYVHRIDPAVGTVFTVVCDGDSQGDPEGDKYTMIAE